MPHQRQLLTVGISAAATAEDDDTIYINAAADAHEDVEMARDKLLHACELAKSLETRIRSMPPDRHSFDVRCSLALSASEAISAFNDAVKCLVSIKPAADAAPQVARSADAVDDPLPSPRVAFPCINSASGGIRKISHVIKQLTATTTTTTSSRSPDLESPASCTDQPSNDPISGAINAESLLRVVDRTSGTAAADSPFTALPVASTISGAAASDSSYMLSPRSAEADWTAARKRKVLSKVTRRIAAEGAVPEMGEGTAAPPLDDGGTWRKYGQKAILGARYPRSYYRCTQRSSRIMDSACTAKKLVQRCDEDPSVFEVTYKGEHTCGGGTGTATATVSTPRDETAKAAAAAAGGTWSSPHMAAQPSATFHVSLVKHNHHNNNNISPPVLQYDHPDGSDGFQQLSHPSRETLRYNSNNEVFPLVLQQNNFATDQRLTFASSSDSIGSSRANVVNTKSLTSMIHSNLHEARAPIDSNAPTAKLSQNTTYQVQVSSTFDTMDFMNFLNSIEHD